METPRLTVLAGPTAVGKGTVVQALGVGVTLARGIVRRSFANLCRSAAEFVRLDRLKPRLQELVAIEGWKISRFIPGCIEFDYGDEAQVDAAMELIRRLHRSGETSPWSLDFHEDAERLFMKNGFA